MSAAISGAATQLDMAKASKAIAQLSPKTVAAIERLGADLAIARLRRKESVASRAKRMGVSKGTLQRLEAGDPTIGIGIVATALWLIGRDEEIGALAAPAHDLTATAQEIHDAIELGRKRSQASSKSRLKMSR